MTGVHDAEDPERYRPESSIRQYLVAQAASTPLTADLATAAVHERWSVKTAADADAQALTTQTPTPTTIAALTALPVPSLLPPDGRSEGAEQTVWQLTATLQAFGREADGDYHMVIADDQGNTMIGEIPDPGDITAPSFFATQIAGARTAFDGHFGIVENITAGSSGETGFREVSVPVTLTGLGFFDFAHGQRGVAPNAIELHPVINIAFNG